MCLRHSHRAADRNMKVYRDHMPMWAARTLKKAKGSREKSEMQVLGHVSATTFIFCCATGATTAPEVSS